MSQGVWRASSMHLSIVHLFAGALALVALTGCGTVSKRVSADGTGAETIVFPDPATATVAGGTFVSVDKLREVTPGMNKPQLYALLGVPHFREGIFGVREWDYVFNFRDADNKVQQCQYKLLFDTDERMRTTYWKPADCQSRVERAAPPVATWTPPPPPPPPPPPAPVVEQAAEPAPAVPVDATPTRLSSDAAFAFGSATLTAAGRERLDSMLLRVQVPTQLHEVHVVGHSDRIGSKRGNLRLSRRRADAVRRYLIDGGVPADHIKADGLGESDPLVQCAQKQRKALAACLAPNRRVEITGLAAGDVVAP